MSKSLTVTSQETIYSSKNYHRQKKTSLNFGHSYWQSSWHFFLFKSALLEKSVTTHKNHNFSVLTCIRNKYEFCKPSMFVPGKFKNNSGTIFYQAQTETNPFSPGPLDAATIELENLKQATWNCIRTSKFYTQSGKIELFSRINETTQHALNGRIILIDSCTVSNFENMTTPGRLELGLTSYVDFHFI